MAGELTIKQTAVLLEITEYCLRNRGDFPTFRIIQRLCNISSTSVVLHYMNHFVEGGYIIRRENVNRYSTYVLSGLTVVPPAWYYDMKAEFIDKKREVLDVDWDAPMETV